MRILALIKQVPEKSVAMDSKDGILDRTQASGRMNPWDYYAIEAALEISEKIGGEVTALTMGPESARDVLKEALSMGCSEAVLLSDKAFAGADVYGTSFTLCQGIKGLGHFDLIVCGQQSTDGDTAQLPFSLAEKLNIKAIGWVKKIEEVKENSITLLQELNLGTQCAAVEYPCLIAVGEGIGKVRIPNLRDQLKAKKKEIRVLSLEDLDNKSPGFYGLKASPTRVIKIKEIEHKFKSRPLKIGAKESAEIIKNTIKEELQ